MLVTCVECGNATSDKAAQCPKCASQPAAFLGTPVPCRECGTFQAPAYPACQSCGAPSEGKPLSQKVAPRLDHARPLLPEEAQPDSPLATPRSEQRTSFGSGELRDELAGEPVYIKLAPLRDFAAPLRFWLAAFAAVMIGEAVMLSGLLWATTPYSFGGPTPQVATQWLDTLVKAEPIFSAARIVALAVCGYYYSRFLFRGLKNLRPVSNGNSTFNPTWGVVMHFVPLANLFGVMAMTDVWNGSHFVAKRPAAANGLIGAWWTFWIGAGLATAVGNRLISEPNQYASGVIAAICASIALLISALLLRTVVERIADAHDGASIPLGRLASDNRTEQKP